MRGLDILPGKTTGFNATRANQAFATHALKNSFKNQLTKQYTNYSIHLMNDQLWP
jgi:hypothetical protein